jgi:hypothetical protein
MRLTARVGYALRGCASRRRLGYAPAGGGTFCEKVPKAWGPCGMAPTNVVNLGKTGYTYKIDDANLYLMNINAAIKHEIDALIAQKDSGDVLKSVS